MLLESPKKEDLPQADFRAPYFRQTHLVLEIDLQKQNE